MTHTLVTVRVFICLGVELGLRQVRRDEGYPYRIEIIDQHGRAGQNVGLLAQYVKPPEFVVDICKIRIFGTLV